MKRQLIIFLMVCNMFAINAFAETPTTAPVPAINSGESTADCFGKPVGYATEGSVNYKAIWNPITYKVKFNPNGGSGAQMPNHPCVYDKDCVLPANTYTRTDYRFDGWCVNATCSVPTYSNGNTVRNLTNVENPPFELFAKWTPVCSSNKWLHIGDGEDDKICLYNSKHESEHPALAVRIGTKTYYIDMSPANLNRHAHDGSSKKLNVLFKGKTYTAHDLTVAE